MSTIQDLKGSFDANISVGELGTQLFWFNKKSKKFEYALPLISGGEYGGETETFEAPEMDLDYIPKISGRTSLSDVTLTSNYTQDRYKRWLEILSNTDAQIYAEVYSDGSASVYSGTSGRPTIQGGEVRQIETTIAPENLIWVDDVKNIQNANENEKTIDQLNDMLKLDTDLVAGGSLPFDETTIPAKRGKFFQGK